MTEPKDTQSGLRGVIFDMDGVLCDSEAYICQAAIAMFRERYGFEPAPEEFLPFVGAGEDRYLGGVAEAHGVPLALPEDKTRTYELYLEIIHGRMDPLPGAVSFIERCRGEGLKLAVASAADRMKVEGNLREIGVPPETFDAIITGSDVTNNKPDPEIFLRAAESMGVDPQSCLVVEDAHNGVRAAKAAGSRCLGLTTSFPADELLALGADATAPDLSETPEDILAV